MSTADFVPSSQIARWQSALPFALSLALLPVLIFAVLTGGWSLILPPLATWTSFAVLDVFVGENERNADPDTPETELFWYRIITMAWFPLQSLICFWMVWYVPAAEHLAWWEKILAFFGMGVLSGTIGIVYSHELMHQKNRLERWLGDLLMGITLYSHFRSEHLLVHHRYVGTPRDGVTARYNEGFHRFLMRVVHHGYPSAWRAEKQMLARRNLPATDLSNPFWRYGAIQGGFLLLAVLLGGWIGFLLFVYQAMVAIWQLELVNYVEHYGLTRKHLGEGKYEHVLPRHSWNSAMAASNWLLINLQRHSDHHYKPDRRFPLLQTYDREQAPQLPYGYPIMTIAALIPPVWFRVMNPRVRKWRAMYYPEITDWAPYKSGKLPMPRGAS